jgi:hypothetical protein
MAASQLSSGSERRAWPAIEGVPVFLHHEIVDGSEFTSRPSNQKHAVTSRQLRDQLTQIKNGCYQVYSVRDVVTGRKAIWVR